MSSEGIQILPLLWRTTSAFTNLKSWLWCCLFSILFSEVPTYCKLEPSSVMKNRVNVIIILREFRSWLMIQQNYSWLFYRFDFQSRTELYTQRFSISVKLRLEWIVVSSLKIENTMILLSFLFSKVREPSTVYTRNF